MSKGYRYPVKEEKMGFSFPKESAWKEEEELTGAIQGLDASDIEERFSRSLGKRRIGYIFRPVFLGGRNMPGSIEVDFLVDFTGHIYMVQIDGEYAHKSTAQKQKDAINDAFLYEEFKDDLAAPVIRIKYDEMDTQESSDLTAKELFPL